MSIDDLWYKNAIIYCLDVEKYQDANGDGVGDFEGLMRRLDYLQGLGVTCLWLQPFYPSPNRDNERLRVALVPRRRSRQRPRPLRSRSHQPEAPNVAPAARDIVSNRG